MSEWDRPAVRQAIQARIQARIDAASDGDPLFGFQIIYSTSDRLPLDAGRYFVIGQSVGSADVAVASRGARSWNDTYSINALVQINAANSTDLDAADDACMAAIRDLFDLLFVTPRLAELVDVALRSGPLEGPNASCLDSINTTSAALFSINVDRAVRGTPT